MLPKFLIAHFHVFPLKLSMHFNVAKPLVIFDKTSSTKSLHLFYIQQARYISSLNDKSALRETPRINIFNH
uniref:Uncharacterized protein n=1 Tax=Kalanchoe fedtschenkoi TaxID=63787 RepID=A0A7N0RDV5_KALFE